MKNFNFLILGTLFMLGSSLGFTTNCPDPQNSSLKLGVIPAPWVLNPFSSNPPENDGSTRFVRANILVAGYGKGVMCTYRAASGDFSIWWQVITKIPSRNDYNWIDTLGGFICTEGLSQCQFSVANP